MIYFKNVLSYFILINCALGDFTDIRVIMDFIPNHTSDEHSWFRRSELCEDPYTDYYVWEPARGFDENGDPIPPNNWVGEL